jgi:hypothetical protein
VEQSPTAISFGKKRNNQRAIRRNYRSEAVMRAILYLWQLPQNLIGLFLIIIFQAREYEITINGKVIRYYVIVKPWYKFSSQKGQYTIVPPKNIGRVKTIRHEYLGHGKQSKITGPFYLLIIGLPSVIRNRISVWRSKPSSWYYGFGPHAHLRAWPEKQADRLGGVVR